MNNRRLWTVVGLFAALLLLALSTSCDGAVLNLRISYQGYLTDALGNPVAGNRSMTFRLWDAATAGNKVCEETQNPVAVNNGVFSVALGSVTPLNPAHFHKPLWLEVVVAGQTMGDRQPLQGAPYAMSLAPGAAIKGNGTTGTYSTTLTVSNIGQGGAFVAYGSSGAGVTAFGSPAVAAYGSIQSTATTVLWISGTSLVRNLADDTTHWDLQTNGAARIWSGAAAGGSKSVYYPVTIPSVLYGQPVTLSKVTVYYRCRDGSKGYIDSTYLLKQTSADSGVTLVIDTTDRTSNSSTSYTLNTAAANSQLSATQGALGLYLNIRFADDINWVQIGGISLELEHH